MIPAELKSMFLLMEGSHDGLHVRAEEEFQRLLTNASGSNSL